MNQRYVSGRRSALGPILFTTGIILLAVVGGAFLLHATDVIQLPFLTKQAPPQRAQLDIRGKIRLPINVRPLEAYSAVQTEDVLNPRTRKIEIVWLPEEVVPKDAIRYEKTAELFGRVLRRDKPAGQFFLESMFYPLGTTPGPAAGVPPGKRALRLSSQAVPGLHGLRQGDRFDITMTVEVEIEEPKRKPSKSNIKVEGPYARLVDEPDPTAADSLPRVKRKRAEVRVVVRDGLLVKPVHHRASVATNSQMRPGSSASKKPIEELIIAVEPSEVTELTHALAIDAHLQVAIRSSQKPEKGTTVEEGEVPDKVVEIEVPRLPENGSGAKPKYRLIETIVGGKKRIIAVPEDGDGEQEKGKEKGADEGGSAKDDG